MVMAGDVASRRRRQGKRGQGATAYDVDEAHAEEQEEVSRKLMHGSV